MAAHVAHASHINPAKILLDRAIPTWARRVGKACTTPPALIRRRLDSTKFLADMAEKLKPANEAWVQRLSSHNPSRALNFSLIKLLIDHLDYPDRSLVEDLANGMPLVGDVQPTNVFPKRERPMRADYQAWKDGLPERNRLMVQRVIKSADTEESRLCWEKTVKEAAAGWLSPPTPVTEAALNSIPLSPRFAKWEVHGERERKIRVIDDLKASGVNDLLGVVETSIPENLDVFLAMARMHEEEAPGRTMQMFSLDFAHAYKHVGIAEDQLDFATIVLCDDKGVPHMATLHTQPFGSGRAPANWARVTSFLQFVLQHLFQVWLGIFVDDCFCIEPKETVGSALASVKALCNLLGLSLANDKENPPCTTMNLLGAQITILRDSVKAALTPKRINDYSVYLRNFLKKGSMSPGEAAKARGKLGFAQSLMFGRFGRALLQPFTTRQYAPALYRGHKMTDDLRRTVNWWIQALHATPPRTVTLDAPAPMLVYTDAQGLGHIAAVIIPPSGKKPRMCHTHIPEWMRAEGLGIGIFEYEMAAAALGVLWATELSPGTPILLCCDNQGANGTVIRGSCTTEIGRDISSLIWRVAAENATHIWVEYVKSTSNPADAPSRCCTGEIITNEFTHFLGCETIPRRFEAAFSNQVALEEFGLNPAGPGVRRWECPPKNN